MSKSKHSRDYTFALIVPPEMTMLVRTSWDPTLNLIQDVIDRYHIPVKKIKLHYHKKPRKTWNSKHPYGHSIYSHCEITLCAQDFDTALHEMAHVWARNPHTDKWARCYLHLLEKYLPPEDFRLKMERAKKMYKPVQRMAHLFEFDVDDED